MTGGGSVDEVDVVSGMCEVRIDGSKEAEEEEVEVEEEDWMEREEVGGAGFVDATTFERRMEDVNVVEEIVVEGCVMIMSEKWSGKEKRCTVTSEIARLEKMKKRKKGIKR